MSIDYTYGLCVGYIISVNDVKRPFLTFVNETSHIEARFDASTGKRLEDIKVVDQEEGEILKLNGKEVEDLNELCEELSKLFKGVTVEPESTYGGWGDSVYFGLDGNDMYTGKDGHEETHISVGQSMHYAKVSSQRTKDRLVRLREKIEALGIKNVGVAKIYTSSYVG